MGQGLHCRVLTLQFYYRIVIILKKKLNQVGLDCTNVHAKPTFQSPNTIQYTSLNIIIQEAHISTSGKLLHYAGHGDSWSICRVLSYI